MNYKLESEIRNENRKLYMKNINNYIKTINGLISQIDINEKYDELDFIVGIDEELEINKNFCDISCLIRCQIEHKNVIKQVKILEEVKKWLENVKKRNEEYEVILVDLLFLKLSNSTTRDKYSNYIYFHNSEISKMLCYTRGDSDLLEEVYLYIKEEYIKNFGEINFLKKWGKK